MNAYMPPLCRIILLDVEKALLTGSTETIPIDPFDPEFDEV
jgi:hypothetical protein